MKLSQKTQYGVRALFDLAFYQRGKPAQVREIAERQGIPARFLEQIFQDLKKAGLVQAKRGPRGGYTLIKAPDELKFGDIVRALEGEQVLGLRDSGSDVQDGDATSRAVSARVFRELGQRIEASLDSLSLENMCEYGEELGLQRKSPGKYVYMI